MKKLINAIPIISISILLCISFVATLKPKDNTNLRVEKAIVVEIDNNIAVLEDLSGNLWEIDNYQGQLQDEIIIVFDNMNTKDITDDSIIEIKTITSK